MYSYGDRMRAVALYIKLGKLVRATLHLLGYTTKNSLKEWCREFQAHQELKVEDARGVPKYTEEQQRTAVNHFYDSVRCISTTVRALG
jgi:putative transposase